MTLREALGGDVRRVYEQVDALLDSEDGVLVLFDGRRLVSFMQGFAVSPSQLELLGVELERALRSIIGKPAATGGGRRNREAAQRVRPGGDVDGARGEPRRVLRLAGKIA